MTPCKLCGKTEGIEFRPHSRQCKACEREKYRAKQQAWAAANREAVRAKVRRHRVKKTADPEYQEKQTEKIRTYRAQHPTKAAEAAKRWRERHPERAKASWSHVRARRRSAGGSITPQEWEAVLTYFSHRCAYCHAPGKQTIDHVDPLAKSGEHTVDNVVPACPSCNSSKNDDLLTVWLAKKARLREVMLYAW